MQRQFRETNAFEQTQNFALEWKHLFHRWSPTLPEIMLQNEGRGFNSHPGPNFFCPCVGAIPKLVLIPNGVIGCEKLLEILLIRNWKHCPYATEGQQLTII